MPPVPDFRVVGVVPGVVVEWRAVNEGRDSVTGNHHTSANSHYYNIVVYVRRVKSVR